jgi:homogentisate 1,2-dioxygenase
MSSHDMLDRPARARSRRPQTDAAPRYMSGFGNSFETEALAGALPIGHPGRRDPV